MDFSAPIPAGPYRLRNDGQPVVGTHPTSPVMLKALLESWCYLNCSGTWDARLDAQPTRDDSPEKVEIRFDSDEDAVLFMLSPEYGYMGNPPLYKA